MDARSPGKFSPGELDFARRMAASLALALENARLYEAEQQARMRAEKTEQRLQLELGTTRILLEASDEFASTIDPDELLDRLGRIVLEATGINRVFINLVDVAREVLTPEGRERAGSSHPPAARSRSTSSVETSLARSEARRRSCSTTSIPTCRSTTGASRGERREAGAVRPADVPGTRSSATSRSTNPTSATTSRPSRSASSRASRPRRSIALQNARQFEREHRIAETLQEALLAEPERIDGVDVSYLYKAAWETSSVGGDFYDVFVLDEEWAVLVVGDVAGKGLMVAPLTALMRDGARAYLLDTPDPGECCRRLNALAYRFTPQDKFATASSSGC